MKVCPRCQTINENDAMFCSNCAFKQPKRIPDRILYIGGGVLFVLILLVMIPSIISDQRKKREAEFVKANQTPTPAPTPVLVPTPVPVSTPPPPAATTVSYDIVERWQIPNGGEGKRITIPANLQTEKGLLSVCDKIEQDVKNDRNAVVLGHKDAKSADIQKRMGKTSAQEEKYLYKNFILSFIKNANGSNQCVVYPNGFDGGTQKVKTY